MMFIVTVLRSKARLHAMQKRLTKFIESSLDQRDSPLSNLQPSFGL